jgi:hypothetical protein
MKSDRNARRGARGPLARAGRRFAGDTPAPSPAIAGATTRPLNTVRGDAHRPSGQGR